MNNQSVECNPASTQSLESLSAIMDGQGEELELRRLIRGAAEDPALRLAWSRYQLVSGLLSSEACEPVRSLSFADRVSERLAQGCSVDNGVAAEAFVSGRKRGVAHFAVAASVALFAIAGLQWQQGSVGPKFAGIQQPVIVTPSLRAAPSQRSEVPILMVSRPLSVDPATGLGLDTRKGLYVLPVLDRPSAERDGVRMAPLAGAVVTPGQ